jgi:signal transduction histidine kinase/ActR/RegA family two-component response regulator
MRKPGKSVHDGPEIRVEQIRLIYSMVGMSVMPAIMVAAILFYTIRKPGIEFAILVWFLVLASCKLFEYFDGRKYSKKTIPLDHVPLHVVRLMFIHGFDAFLWSTIAWIALDTATATQAILIISVLSGIIGGAVSLMSPVPRVFYSYIIVDTVVLVPRFLTMQDQSYAALALIVIPYFAAMAMLARTSYLATRESILLKFQNQELVNNLEAEAQKAKTAHAEALEANVAKSRFLAAASHDLRQPIHALGLFIEVLRMNRKLPKQAAIIENASSAAKATANMLDTLLDFSRVEAGVISPTKSVFAVQDILTALESELAVLADEKKLAYRYRDSQHFTRSDPSIVSLVLRNLVSNAIRYTEKGGILIVSRKRGDHLSLEVWDSGIGIPREHMKDIFNEFYQVGNAERDRRKGLGLGLSIASRLAESLGSKLTVASRFGRGSVFKLELPLVPAPAVIETSMMTVATSAPQTISKGAHILLLDDDEIVRLGMSELLENWGYRCTPVAKVPEALQVIEQKRPDLLISDFRLSDDLNGLEAIQLLKQRASEPLPALLITGDTAPDRLVEAAESGLRVLHKPVPAEILMREIERALQFEPSTS